jgi:hypothetical protein
MTKDTSIITPWGEVQESVIYLEDGIYFYETEGHGGFFVEEKYNLMIPETERAEDGFYEEDCEALKVQYYLHHLIESKLEYSKGQFAKWIEEDFGKLPS